MRPLLVEVEGFSTFRERTTIDFTDVDLAALWGPTGSGKSTIVDAVTFALYGSVARYDDNRLIAPIINQLCTEAKVRLDFEIGDQCYTAVRVIRRTKSGGATTKEARLEHGDGADATVLAGSQNEMAPSVEALLGMNFEQFTKTVVLPQGDFAAFLHDSPAERQKLLRQLLDLGIYARMGEEARRRAGVAKTKREVLAQQLAEGEIVTAEQLADMKERSETLQRVRQTLAVALPELTALTETAAALQADVERLDGHLDRLGTVAVPSDATDLGDQLAAARRALVEAEEATAAARQARDAADQAVAAGPDRTRCEHLLDLHTERTTAAEAMDVLTDAAETAAAELKRATVQSEEALTEREDADQRHEAARIAAGTAGLRSSLAVGEPCPVCEQVVTDLPVHDLDAELRAAQQRRDAARAAFAEADAARRAAFEASTRAVSGLDAAATTLAAVDSKLEESPGPDQLRADLAAAGELQEARDVAVAALAGAHAAEQGARAAVDHLLERERQLRHSFGELRDTVAALDPPAPAGRSLVDDWSELAAWADTTATKLRSERKANNATLHQRSAEREAKQAEISDLCAPYLDGPAPANLLEHFATLATKAEADLAHATERLAEIAELETKIAALATDATVAGDLGRLLSAKGFEQWLMEEAVADLVDRATERLLELSNDQYSLVADRTEFKIRDHRNADEVRDARTLSGGETFLASLALALALADSIADLAPEGAPRLESIFLDEGFGTLDPETLDVVASAIEELGAAGRMVTIVTHIRELADRMPVRFEVVKGATSSSVARVEV